MARRSGRRRRAPPSPGTATRCGRRDRARGARGRSAARRATAASYAAAAASTVSPALAHRVDRARLHPVEEHGAGHALVGLGIVDRHPALVAEPHVDPRPTRASPRRELLVARAGGAAAREGDRRAAPRRRPASANAAGTSSTTRISPCTAVMIRTMERDTVAVYEAAGRGVARSAPAAVPRPGASARRDACRRARCSVDLGCGAGLHLPYLAASGRRARRRLRDGARSPATPRPTRWPVQADLEALPFRRGALGGGLGARELPPRPDERLPCGARRAAPGARGRRAAAPRCCTRATTSGPLADDDFPGRFFAAWSPDALADVLDGAGFDRRRVRGRRRRADWLDGAGDARPHAARHRRARHAAARVRAEPERLRGRRRRRASPARQPLLARRARGRAS